LTAPSAAREHRSLVISRSVASLLLLCAALGCSPDAPHDNPLDPDNDRPNGIYGTVYRRSGGRLPGVAITATPANVTVSTGQSGEYSLDLPAGRYRIEATKPGWLTAMDTVESQDQQRVQHNFIMTGLAEIPSASAKVNTDVIRREDGTSRYAIHPRCLVTNPDRVDDLSEYTVDCRIDSLSFPPDSAANLDTQTRRFVWNIDSIPGMANFPATIPGRLVSFVASNGSYTTLVPNKPVPAFMNLLPFNLAPSNHAAFVLPGTFQWENGQAAVNTTVQICSGASCIWAQGATGQTQLLCDTTLSPGLYLWRVVTTDPAGNVGAAEATFRIW
jgi:hypothetical protein